MSRGIVSCRFSYSLFYVRLGRRNDIIGQMLVMRECRDFGEVRRAVVAENQGVVFVLIVIPIVEKLQILTIDNNRLAYFEQMPVIEANTDSQINPLRRE